MELLARKREPELRIKGPGQGTAARTDARKSVVGAIGMYLTLYSRVLVKG
jgi:hypothetical protein